MKRDISARDTKNHSARVDAFWTQFLLTGLAIMAVLLGIMSHPGDANYSYVQNSLLAGTLLIALLFLLTRKKHSDMLSSLKRALARPRSVTIEDGTHLLRLLMFASSLACLFVLDFGGMDASFRLGGVAAVGLFRIVSGLIRPSDRE